MNTKVIIGLALACVINQVAIAQESTNSQLILRVQYNGMAQHLFFVGESKWSSATCPSATYIKISANEVPGYKELMSIGLSAKLAGKKVSFWGYCDNNADYFNAFYIVME